MTDQRDGHSKAQQRSIMADMIKILPELRGYAFRLTRNRENAEDLAQSTLVKAIAAVDSFEPGTNLTAWLFRIQRNEFISELRRTRKMSSLDESVGDLNSASLRSFSKEAVDDHMHLGEVLLYLACISPDQRDAIVGATYLALPYDELSEIFGVSIGTIKSRVSRGRDQLEQLMRIGYLKTVDVMPLKRATRGVPKSHRFYPIAKAYEDLYANCEGGFSEGKRTVTAPESAPCEPRRAEEDRLWEELVKSGALDQEEV